MTKSKQQIRVLTLYGHGFNCYDETKDAFERAGAKIGIPTRADILHMDEFLRRPILLTPKYHILAVGGGFTFGDHIEAGRVLANRLLEVKHAIGVFRGRGFPSIWICNGAQAALKGGFLPDGMRGDRQVASFSPNDSGRFEDSEVYLVGDKESKCVWSKGIFEIKQPRRNGESKFIPESQEVFDALERNHQFPFRYADPRTKLPTMEYPWNPSGSVGAVAAVSDKSGLAMAIMPHPECYRVVWNDPHWDYLKRELGRETVAKLDGMGLPVLANGIMAAHDNLLRR